MKKFFLILAIFFSIFIIDQVHAQESGSLEEDFEEDPVRFFSPEGRGMEFLFFISGVAVYSIFVWYFYRFISKRELITQHYSKQGEDKISKSGIVRYIITYVTIFPLIIFVWFFVLGYFIFIIAQDMPISVAFFISMAVIGVVRIVAYFREDAAKEVAKMIPFAILSLFLTSAVMYSDPNFLEPDELLEGVDLLVNKPLTVIPYVLTVVMFEWVFRVIFIIKRKFLPVSDKNLEEEIEKDIDERLKIHYKKIEDKEKNLEKKLEEMMQKLKDSKNSA